MYSTERSSGQTSGLSERHPDTPIALSVRLALPGLELPSASIGMAPDTIPYEFLDVLWSRGLCQGVHEAIKRIGFSYVTSSVHVEFADLNIPRQLDALTDDELENLRL